MKFTLAWLRDHLDTEADVSTIAETLTRIGLEVEGVEDPAEKLAAFRIAKVISAERHPQADKLQILSVDAGDGPQQVVCGAPNARAGLIGVFGPPGAIVPANVMLLKVASIRGVESNGMMCSSRELELGEEHDGIIELQADAPVGESFADWAGLNDPVFDVAITPNRQDCMGVRGIARDLAAARLGVLKPLDLRSVDAAFDCPVEVRTDDLEGCPAFYARVIREVGNGASPDWMQRRLKAIGQRPISALVDVTNYVMFDLGRPSHAYDLTKLSGPVIARRARAGETATALNGKTYALTPEMTVIADAQGVHDIAGIMGGEHSAVSESTTGILLEVAYFTPQRIAKTGQALSLTSDARARFERGVDPAFLDDAVEILTARIVALCGGQASKVIQAGTPPVERRGVQYAPSLCAYIGGVEIAEQRQRDILESLGFTVGDEWRVTVPTWRRDVDGPADLVEEIVRIHGLDHVISTPLTRAAAVAKPTATPAQIVEGRVRRTAAARGLNEALTWSFVGAAEAAHFGGGARRIANPISEDMKVMRPSLLPGLLAAARRNLDRDETSVRLFEVGRRYLPEAERATIAVVLAGERQPRGWASGKAQPFDTFDAKAEALALLEAAGAPPGNLQIMEEAGDHFHPGQSATLRLGPKAVLARFGALHPAVAKAFGIDVALVAVEIDLAAMPQKRSASVARPAFAPSALQVVRRDFAFIVPDTMAAYGLVRAICGADKASIAGASVFDRFVGTGVPEGQVSLAVEVILQPGEASFTEPELKAIADRVVAAAAKFGATLRT